MGGFQRVYTPTYTYDAKGKLVNFTPSGATNDTVAIHTLLDPRIPGPRSLNAGNLEVESDTTSSSVLVPLHDNIQTERFRILRETLPGAILSTNTNKAWVQKRLNSKKLYKEPLSMTSPPITRVKTLASQVGYSSDLTPDKLDVYPITTAAPIMTLGNNRNNRKD